MPIERSFDHLTSTGERERRTLSPLFFTIDEHHPGRPLMAMLSVLAFNYEGREAKFTPGPLYHEGVKQITALLLTHVLGKDHEIGELSEITLVPPDDGVVFKIYLHHTWREVHTTGRHYFRQNISFELVL